MDIAQFCSRVFSNMTAKHTYKFLPSWNVLKFSVSVQIGIFAFAATHEQPFPLTPFFFPRRHPACCDSGWLELWLAVLPIFVPHLFTLGVSSRLCDNNPGYTSDQIPYAINKQTNKQTPVSNGRLISTVGKVLRTYNRNHAIKVQIPLPLHINLSLEELLTDCTIVVPSVGSCWLSVMNSRYNTNCTTVLNEHAWRCTNKKNGELRT